MKAAPAARDGAGDLRVAALVALATLAVTVLVNLPFLGSYAPSGDTPGLLLHSTRFFPCSPVEWVTQGFSRYFVNFPEATRPYTDFVRPTVNLSFWLESLLAGSPGSRLFLATNYLGHAACAGLTFLVARRIGAVGRPRAVLAAVLFAGSLAALELLLSPAFRGDMLGALLGGAALLLVDAHLRTGGGWRLALVLLLLALAVLAKETAVAAPVVAAGWALWAPASEPRGEGRRRRRLALLLLAPLAVFLAARWLGPGGGVYTSFSRIHVSTVQTLAAAFFPGAGALELAALVRGQAQPDLRSLRWGVALALNLAGWVLLLAAWRRPGASRLRVLAGMMLVALAVPMAMAPEPRFTYLGQLFALPLFAGVLPRGGRPARRAAAALAAAALLAGPAFLAWRLLALQPHHVALGRDARALDRALAATLRDPAVRRLYLVNDRSYGAMASLRMAAHRARRADVALRVTNTLGTSGAPQHGTMRVERAGGELRVEVSCAAGCTVDFPGVLPEGRARLGVPGTIRYDAVADRRIAFALPGAARGDLALVGFDPAAPGVHVLAPGDSAWHRVAP